MWGWQTGLDDSTIEIIDTLTGTASQMQSFGIGMYYWGAGAALMSNPFTATVGAAMITKGTASIFLGYAKYRGQQYAEEQLRIRALGTETTMGVAEYWT